MSKVEQTNYPLVSVAIITYNQEDLIEETIQSVLSQDYQNLEIIIGDDASTDGTPNKVRTALENSQIPLQLIERGQNIGITRNLNDVIRRCNGKYIALLGGDDAWIPSKISKAVATLEQHPDASFLCHGSIIVDEEGLETGDTLSPSAEKCFFDGKDCYSGKYRFYGSTQVIRNVQGMPLLRESILYASDLIHSAELIEHYGHAIALPDLLTRYRKSSRGVTIGKRKQIQQDGIQGAAILALEYPEYGAICINRMSKALYSKGISALRVKDYRDALNLMKTSFRLRPGYKSAIRYLEAAFRLLSERKT